MKKTVAFLLTIIIVLMTLSCVMTVSVSAAELKVVDVFSSLKTQGRVGYVDTDNDSKEDTLLLDYSASGIIFNAECSGDINITFKTLNIVETNQNGGLYFTVIVDGKMIAEDKRINIVNDISIWGMNVGYPFHITNVGEQTFTVAEDLEQGSHTIEIYRQTEGALGQFGIKSISLDGRLTTPPAENELYIDFIGDSITAAYGNIGTGSYNHGGKPLYQDATRGYAYLTAKKLNADFSIIARSGITATEKLGFAGENSISMQTVYPKQRYYFDKETQYNFNRQPDAVVLALGTNDLSQYKSEANKKDEAFVQNGFIDMLKIVRYYNPDAKIIVPYGMMIANSSNNILLNAIEEFGGEDEGVYTVQLPKNPAGAGAHPNLEVQAVYADLVAQKIEYALGRKTEADKSQIDTTSCEDASSVDSVSSEGVPTTPNADTEGGKTGDESKNDLNVLYVVIPIVVVLLVGGGIGVYFYLKRKK